jgi:alanine racemase
MSPFPSRPTWIEVDRDSLANNVRKLRRRLAPGTRLMAVVKANAYGHGAVETTRVLLRAGADACAVATLSEALELRDGGITAPVLVLGYTPPHQAGEAAHRDVTLTLYDSETAVACATNVSFASDSPLKVHVKINTGMNRLGVDPADAVALLEALREMPSLAVEGIFTHFATSDEFDRSHAQRQYDLFRDVLALLTAHNLRPPVAHAANSAAILTMPDTHLDMARAGIALYGLDPDPEQCPLPNGFRPALAWKSTVSQVRILKPGDAVSYGREFIADRPMPVAVLPVGYADGFPRRPHTWEYALVGGQPAPILGRVCMDQTVVDVTAAFLMNGGVEMGDEAVLIGRQNDMRITAEEASTRVGTNNYDIVSRILARVPRVYLGSA